MSEPVAPDGEEFGVDLRWPDGGVEPADAVPAPPAGRPDSAPRASGPPDEEGRRAAVTVRQVLSEYLGGRNDELARMNGVLRQLRAGVDDVAASLHRVAASTASLSSEIT